MRSVGIMMEGPPLEPPLYSKCSINNNHSYSQAQAPKSYQCILLLVYYKIFDENEPSKVREPIYFNNPYIGRVNANDIPPPHTVSSLVGAICAKEGGGLGIAW